MASYIFSKTVSLLRHAVHAATAILFVGFSSLILIQVFFRYALNDSIFWAEEVSRLAFFGVLMLTMPMVCDRKAHIVMDLLEAMLAPRWRCKLEKLNALIMIAFFAIFAWTGMELVQQSQFMMTSTTNFSMAYVYALVPISALLSIVFVVNNWTARGGDNE
ncbi:MAG: TRAP transporter small permease [Pusillimonas sp.]